LDKYYTSQSQTHLQESISHFSPSQSDYQIIEGQLQKGIAKSIKLPTDYEAQIVPELKDIMYDH
jgi:hypothetical protein